jgi:pterin-4a-carbinolamine dehydratase
MAAEKADHHPDSLGRTAGTESHVALSTHSAGGVTTLDTGMAAAIDRVAPASP